MADSARRRLAALHAATDRRRWRLLTHAVEIGPFAATRAASIARLSKASGNARTTHAEGLCRVRLLKREPGRPVRYRVTKRGEEVYKALKQVLDQPTVTASDVTTLSPGDHLDIVASRDEVSRQRATFRISRTA